jgi:3-hydroxyisobutyrate dehydrogenase-like beta-hydroxyacid dehydrogenase
MNSATKRIGLVGLGRMGAAIGERLLDQGYALSVWNRSSEKAQSLVERGAQLSPTLTELAASCNIILVIVRDDEALESIYFASNGLLSCLGSEHLLIDMTTASGHAIDRVAQAVRAKGGGYIDAPVSGTVGPARQGQLLVMFGGSEDDVTRAAPVLESLARKVKHMGPVGSGIAMKLVLNMPLATYWHALGEALALGRAQGLQLEQMLELIVDSKAAIGALASKMPAIKEPSSKVEFDLAGLHKDLNAMCITGRHIGLSLRSSEVAMEATGRALAAGWGDQDLAALVRFVATEAPLQHKEIQ